ncbi:nitroreductase family protein (plasmid) [Paraclostridium ghonii]|uniref:nitroreductase family protein n=1 Tax=Paraclostridium ghonii TaxID=29358 RepID=UPI00202CB21A|nr:nitroreductase family protein [Paeniclostridium ghonii]MCM0165401.1 nitroreductase family protein [Paeniclostridium ghonii]
MLSAIENRRSIRKFSNKDVPSNIIKDIIESGTKAPSAKNRQPWKFIVVQGDSKQEMISAFEKGFEREITSDDPLLPNSKIHINGTKYSLEIMKNAPVTIFIINTASKGLFANLSNEEKIYEFANTQSISASIENMLIEATHRGLGTLWICDIFFAYKELHNWLNVEGEMVAAISLGYPLETPKQRPRKKIDDVIEWRK